MDDLKLLFYKIIIAVLRFYSSISKKLKNFFLIYFSWLCKPLSSKKHKITVLLLIALVVTIIMIYITFKKPVPPEELVFFNEATGEELEGEVYIDRTLIGDTSGKMQEIPSLYCKGTHKIMLKSGDHTLKWESKPSDCELKRVIYTVKLPAKTGVESVTLKFMLRDTKELLSGNISFDGAVFGYTEGTLEIAASKCAEIGLVKLDMADTMTNGKNFIEWAHDPSWCVKYDPIVYSVSEGEVG